MMIFVDGNEVARARTCAGLTQAEAARLCRMTLGAYRRMEYGQRPVTKKARHRLACAECATQHKEDMKCCL